MLAASAISALALVGTSGAALAQDESPAAQDAETATQGQAHPLHIHSGTCDQLGDIVFPLGEISQELMVHGEAAGDDMVGSMTEQPVALNVTAVAATIDDLTGEDHAINIHRSEEAMGEYIACGDIGGTRIDGNTLVIRLSPLNDSGYIGFGLFREGEDGNTTVYSMLTETESVSAPMEPGAEDPAMESPAAADPAMESPAAEDPAMESPAAEESPSADVTVEITVDGDEDVDVDVEEGTEESPAA
jgi:hypothetical protein